MKETSPVPSAASLLKRSNEAGRGALSSIELAARNGRAPRRNAGAPRDCFVGTGEMAALMRATDWSKTPLGPVETWSLSLRMMVELAAGQPLAAAALVGAAIHLDLQRRLSSDPRKQAPEVARAARQRVLGGDLAHPEAADRHAISTAARRPGWMTSSSRSIGTALSRRRISPSPIVRFPTTPRRAASAGCWRPCTRSPRRSSASGACMALRDLGLGRRRRRRRRRRAPIAAAALGDHAKDVPFALFYIIDGDRAEARLASAVGIGIGESAAPLRVLTLAEPAPVSRLAAWRSGPQRGHRRRRRPRHARFPASRPAPGPIRRARPPSSRSGPTPRTGWPAFLVAGVSARLRVRRRIPQLLRARGCPDRDRHRQRAGLRGGAQAGRGAGRDRPRQDCVLLQRQPRVSHAADPDAGAASRMCSPTSGDALAPEQPRRSLRSRIATACGS